MYSGVLVSDPERYGYDVTKHELNVGTISIWAFKRSSVLTGPTPFANAL